MGGSGVRGREYGGGLTGEDRVSEPPDGDWDRVPPVFVVPGGAADALCGRGHHTRGTEFIEAGFAAQRAATQAVALAGAWSHSAIWASATAATPPVENAASGSRYPGRQGKD